MKNFQKIKSIKMYQIQGMEKNAKMYTDLYSDEHLRLHNEVDGIFLFI
jgi:hypothetical protein